MLKTPLIELYDQAGVKFFRLHDIEVVQTFSDYKEEWFTLNNEAVIADLGILKRFELKGPDTIDFLHRMTSSDIKSLKSPTLQKSTLLTPQGKLIAPLTLCNTMNGILILNQPNKNYDTLQIIKQFIITDNVEINDWKNQYGIFSLLGPQQDKLFTSIFPHHSVPPKTQFCEIPTKSETLLCLNTNLMGLDGYHLIYPLGLLNELMHRLSSIQNLQPVGFSTLNAYRIAQGMPWQNFEINQKYLPVDLGLDDHLDYTKGCYPGQEIIARLKYLGQPAYQLSGILFQDDPKLSLPQPLFLNKIKVGELTSLAPIPNGRWIGLGLIQSKVYELNLSLSTQASEEGKATLCALPIPL